MSLKNLLLCLPTFGGAANSFSGKEKGGFIAVNESDTSCPDKKIGYSHYTSSRETYLNSYDCYDCTTGRHGEARLSRS